MSQNWSDQNFRSDEDEHQNPQSENSLNSEDSLQSYYTEDHSELDMNQKILSNSLNDASNLQLKKQKYKTQNAQLKKELTKLQEEGIKMQKINVLLQQALGQQSDIIQRLNIKIRQLQSENQRKSLNEKNLQQISNALKQNVLLLSQKCLYFTKNQRQLQRLQDSLKNYTIDLSLALNQNRLKNDQINTLQKALKQSQQKYDRQLRKLKEDIDKLRQQRLKLIYSSQDNIQQLINIYKKQTNKTQEEIVQSQIIRCQKKLAKLKKFINQPKNSQIIQLKLKNEVHSKVF